VSLSQIASDLVLGHSDIVFAGHRRVFLAGGFGPVCGRDGITSKGDVESRREVVK